MRSSRRTFFFLSLCGSSAFAALAASRAVFAQTPAAVLDTDPQALALGYKTDGSKTEKTKYPNYAANQSCSGCVLFQGKATDSSSPCAVFGGKLVSGKGWCSAWAKKA
jgi:High potential iron-sulfur protein